MAKRYEFALHPTSNLLEASSIADGNYDFKLGGGGVTGYVASPLNNLVNYFYFVDISGNPIAATSGTVDITGSPDGGKTWLTMRNGSFDAAMALNTDLNRPNGISQITHARITLTSIVGAGIVGFTSEFIQTQGI